MDMRFSVEAEEEGFEPSTGGNQPQRLSGRAIPVPAGQPDVHQPSTKLSSPVTWPARIHRLVGDSPPQVCPSAWTIVRLWAGNDHAADIRGVRFW